VLDAAGSSIKSVVKVNIFLADMKDFADMNEVYGQVFLLVIGDAKGRRLESPSRRGVVLR
jgi:enamine deaminase RidA (YjgF/YER057c/UK114 family)